MLRQLLFPTLTLEFRDEAKLGFVTATMITQVLKTTNLAPASETATAFVFNSLQSVNFSKLPTMSRRYNFLEFWSAPIVFWFRCLRLLQHCIAPPWISLFLLQCRISLFNRAIRIDNSRHQAHPSSVKSPDIAFSTIIIAVSLSR